MQSLKNSYQNPESALVYCFTNTTGYQLDVSSTMEYATCARENISQQVERK